MAKTFDIGGVAVTPEFQARRITDKFGKQQTIYFNPADPSQNIVGGRNDAIEEFISQGGRQFEAQDATQFAGLEKVIKDIGVGSLFQERFGRQTNIPLTGEALGVFQSGGGTNIAPTIPEQELFQAAGARLPAREPVASAGGGRPTLQAKTKLVNGQRIDIATGKPFVDTQGGGTARTIANIDKDLLNAPLGSDARSKLLTEKTMILLKEASAQTGITPDLPPSLAAQYTSSYSAPDPDVWQQGEATSIQSTGNQIDKAYEDQLKTIEKRLKAAEEKAAKYEKKTLEAIEGTAPGNLPYDAQLDRIARAELDVAESEANKLQEDYTKRRELVAQIETLWTQAANEINLLRSGTGLSAIRSPRIQQTIDDYNARKGVLEAAINGVSSNIEGAYNAINQAQEDATARRQDQINYYNTLANFYSSQEAQEEQKGMALLGYEQNIIQAQIQRLENEETRAFEAAAEIRRLMTDPATAALAAKAGISMNMSVAEISQRIGKAAGEQDAQDTINQFTSKGAREISQAEYNLKPAHQTSSFVDTNGKTHYFFQAEAPKVATGTGGGGDGGGLTTSPFTTGDKRKLQDVGVPLDIATQIYEALIAGASLDEIRDALRDNGYSPALLDLFDQALDRNIGDLNQPDEGVSNPF